MPLTRIQGLLESLGKAGLEVPSRRVAAVILREGGGGGGSWGEATPASGGHRAEQYGFEALIELVWAPLGAVVDEVVSSKQPGASGLSPGASRNLEYLSQEMVGHAVGALTPRPFEEWLDQFQGILEDFAGTRPPARFASAVVGLLVPFVFPPTPAAAYLLAGSSVAGALLGRSMASRCHRRALAFITDLSLEEPLADILGQGVRADLVEALAKLWGPAAQDRPPAEEVTDLEGDSSGGRKRPSRTAANMRKLLAERTQHLRWALRNRLALKNIPQALGDAFDLFSASASAEAEHLLEPPSGGSHWTLMRHLILLDSALDRWVAEDLTEARLSGAFGGICVATDESPPSEGRFGGMRFQVTFVYIALFPDAEAWEFAAEPPVRTISILADILHCPGKRGEDLLPILDKQVGRLGLLRADIVSCTTDGGGENEGRSGIHKLLESDNPSYVRRRCLPHLAWRTSDAAINCCTEHLGAYKNLAAYLADGVTWRRLRTIACTPKAEGGLGLFADGSAACKRIFHRMPGVVISTRPQTDMAVLEFLRGKESVLYNLASLDIKQRRLGTTTSETIETLRSQPKNICRGIVAEILHRCLFLMYWTTKRNLVAKESSWESLMAEASSTILSLDIDEGVLGRLGLAQGDLERKGWRPKTWVELVVLLICGSADAARDRLKEALDFHRLVADKAASHLSLTQDNIYGTPWLAARLLSSSALEAQASAKDLARHIAKTPPANRTLFEAHLFETSELWTELEAFGNATPPVPLWKGRRRFENLFRFFAPRFLVAPDHVLDCERQHARWKWMCGAKRGLKLPGLTAFLKCTSYLEKHDGEFPPDESLEEHLEASRAQLRWDYNEACQAEDLAPGWRQEMVWAGRFNLRSEDHGPLEAPPQPAAPRQDTSFGARWRNYIRTILRRGHWYAFASCPSVYFYVSENKVVAGRGSRGEGEAVGRNLAVAFFEPLGTAGPGEPRIVRRVLREDLSMKPRLLTIAELMSNCGILLPIDASRTAAESELALEEAFARSDLRKFTGHLETEAEEVHVYSLADEVPAEAAFLESEPIENLSKMALARLLELREEGGRRELFAMTWEALRARADMGALDGAAGPPPQPGRRARGRGGKGAKGRGRQ